MSDLGILVKWIGNSAFSYYAEIRDRCWGLCNEYGIKYVMKAFAGLLLA